MKKHAPCRQVFCRLYSDTSYAQSLPVEPAATFAMISPFPEVSP